MCMWLFVGGWWARCDGFGVDGVGECGEADGRWCGAECADGFVGGGCPVGVVGGGDARAWREFGLGGGALR